MGNKALRDSPQPLCSHRGGAASLSATTDKDKSISAKTSSNIVFTETSSNFVSAVLDAVSVKHVLRLWLCVAILTITIMTPTGASAQNSHRPGGLTLSEVDGKTLFRSLRASSCSLDCTSAEQETVCGTDDVTYASRCELQRAKQCDGKRGTNGQRVRVHKKGSCNGEVLSQSKCHEERLVARKMARLESMLVPSCQADGSYTEVQCHKGTHTCWCVSPRDGRHIPGTIVDSTRRVPRCNKVRRRRRKERPSKKKKRRKDCSTQEQQLFEEELVKVFSEEYSRMVQAHQPHTAASGGQDDLELQKKIVMWKFRQLDQNADHLLSFKEIRSFRRMVKKLIKPRRCAKRFHRFCDKNNDRRINESEWSLCLGVGIKISFRIFLELNNHLDEDNRTAGGQPHPSTRQEPSGRDCVEERRAALIHARDEPSAKVYIPRCQDNGRWNPAQCHNFTRYCWCVREDTGEPIRGMVSYQLEPNCTIQKDTRKMKGVTFAGCPFDQKRRFIVTLMEDFQREMNDSHSVPHSPGSHEGEMSTREQLARWKLQSLDKNRNNVLERSEWRDLRKSLKKNKRYPRKCRRRFLRHCDADDDKTLTLHEWRECLGLNHNLFMSLPRDPKIKQQKNPFLEQLT